MNAKPNCKNLEEICDFIRKESAIDIKPGKEYLLESRLMPVARELGLSGIDQLAAELRQGVRRHVKIKIIEAMTTNETSFFRDQHPFDLLKEKLIPETIRRRSGQRKMTIWSAACSSGQEPYSIAMLIQETFPELSKWNVRIIATDLDQTILDRAATGTYTRTEINRGLSPILRNRYFVADGVNWKVCRELRAMLTFKQLNFVSYWPTLLDDVDIIFIRNVLIYFTPEVKEKILIRAAGVMNPEGFLVLGGSETTMNLDVPLVRNTSGRATFYTAAQP